MVTTSDEDGAFAFEDVHLADGSSGRSQARKDMC